MKLKYVLLNMGLVILFFSNCSANYGVSEPEMNEAQDLNEDTTPPNQTGLIKILALGDSYTIGESVCDTCRFPEQLKDSIKAKNPDRGAELKVIARTGWTTTNLKNAISNEILSQDYDLVTLLIGVNNQFQGRPFDLFEKEFPELVTEAIKYASGKKKNLIVISIPDYAFTPFGKANSAISQGINLYNDYTRTYCEANNITYVFITDITRQGIEKPELVASDGLHPSTLAYSKFVTRILPFALEKIGYNSN
ncbi:SGNH/GDSL hydrolase family protein [Hyunsoonleella ulvae]|uniref:SGNH/GDSL hydrolase family protein n=1 Tax=Hyunsoonleella ulvae TaxID=2799948 RepID=UPI00193A617C|nr:SGNH/GDSL hydrolase family protein [Hyunsoonleella ulvae]